MSLERVPRSPGRRRLRILLGAGALLAVVLIAACSGGRQPETGGVDPADFMARFSGEWVLDEAVSDDPAEAADPEAIRTGPRQGGGGLGGGATGRGGGRGGGAIGAQTPSVPDTEAVEATFELFRTVPARFTLQVGSSEVTTTWLGPEGAREGRMEVAGDGITTGVGDRRIDTDVRWEGRYLRIERRIPGGATVVDLIESLGDGERLLVTRTLEGLPLEIPPVRLAFDAVGGPQES